MTLKILKTVKDSDLYYYAKEIEINNRRFKTPFSMMHKSIKSSGLPNTQNSRMYEIWKNINANDLKGVLTDIGKQKKLNEKIKSGIDRRTRNHLKIYLLAIKGFSGNPLNFFNDQLIEFLIDSTYLYTDIITFPIIRRLMDFITNEKMKDQLIDLIKKCHTIAETLNNKPIMAIIPPLPINYIPPIVKTYLELGIKMFCFNFEGSSLSAYYQNYFNVLRSLYRYDSKTFGEKIKYILNLILPQNRFKYQPFPAIDLMTPALSTDIIGLNHIVGGSPKPKKTGKNGIKTGNQSKRKVIRTNLLNTDQYNYHRVKNMSEFNNIFKNPVVTPKFSDFPEIKPSDRYEFKREFNYLNKNSEMLRIHKEIISNNPIQKYINNKEGIRKDLFSKSSLLDLSLNTRSLNGFIH